MNNFNDTYVFSAHGDYFPKVILDDTLRTYWQINSRSLDDLLLKLTIGFIEEGRGV